MSVTPVSGPIYKAFMSPQVCLIGGGRTTPSDATFNSQSYIKETCFCQELYALAREKAFLFFNGGRFSHVLHSAIFTDMCLKLYAHA